MNKRETHIVQGMTRDLSVGRFNPNMVVDARNIRITALKDNKTLLAVTNEKGTSEFQVDGAVEGVIIGSASFSKVLVLFTTTGTPTNDGIDRIYRLDFNNDYSSAECTTLFDNHAGSDGLHFDYKHPLETLPIYENDQIQKVYWVDGKNQPRVIDITKGYQTNADVFNFNRSIGGQHVMEVTKYDTGGEFPSGTVQYCFNYFNKFGQETNIVDVSPLYYLSPKESGLPADAKSVVSFVVTLYSLDINYDYVRLYSIVRTSENATPNVRIVGDYKITPVYPIPTVNSTDGDVVIPDNSFYVVEGNTFTPKFKVSDKFGTPQSLTEFELGDNEFLCNIATGEIYLYEANYTELKQFCISYADGYFTLPQIGTMNASRLYSGEISNLSSQRLSIVDNGIIGSTIDATALLFIGGQDIVAETMTSKDNTLFLGNIKQNVPNIGELEVNSSTVSNEVRGKASACSFDYNGSERTSSILPSSSDEAEYVSESGFFDDPVDNNRSSYNKKSFKARENYRLGFIAQYKTGQWSEAVWIDDLYETEAPGRHVFYLKNGHPDWGPSYRKPGFKAEIPSSVVNTLLNNGFIRVAPVVVYPNDAERVVLFQGILASTVFNVKDRDDNSPFVQADWRFRSGYTWENIVGEIQTNPIGYANKYPINIYSREKDFVKYFPNEYYRDPSILTFHSPDLESDEDIAQSDLSGLKMRIVGLSNAGLNESNVFEPASPVIDAFLTVETQGFNVEKSTVLSYKSGYSWQEGYVPRSGTSTPTASYLYTDIDTDLSYYGFYDSAIFEWPPFGSTLSGTKRYKVSDNMYNWVTYLWHRNGSLNNQAELSAELMKEGYNIRYAMLKKKCISEIKYARTTFFQNNGVTPFDIDVPIHKPKLFDSDQLGVEKIDVFDGSGVLYYGNIDKVIITSFDDLSDVDIESGYPNKTKGFDFSDGYPIYGNEVAEYTEPNRNSRPISSSIQYISRASRRISDNDSEPEIVDESITKKSRGKDPVRMKYKTTKHLVIGLSNDSETEIPQLGVTISNELDPESGFKPFWKDFSKTYTFKNVVTSSLPGIIGDLEGIHNSIFVAELYREFSEEQKAARFGGTSKEAIANNVWIRCGESKRLEENLDVTLYFREGDTYVGRYDCLKSYPFTEEDQNQIVSIYSTELESRVNLDERYDKNKGLTSNMYVRPTNFNLFNHPGYEQTNQFFVHKAIDYDRYKSLKYPNLFTWSLEKKMGADIDSWTSITMTSTADARGELGDITSLKAFNNNIFLFQPRGVAQILFNERVQIPTGDGQPIEITNGLKYSGLRYLTDQIGLTNKWSLQDTPYGMYFIDDVKNTLYLFNGQQFNDLSSKEGLNTWLSENNSYDVWNPVEYNNVRTFYDKVNKDLYFTTKNETLIYSELAGHFTSFMDYAKLPALIGMNDKLFTFTRNSNNVNTVWEMFAGDYNKFFGELKPYWLTFVSNADPTYDKVFNSLAWRSENYSGTEFKPLKTFDTLRVWNEHQDTGEVDLVDTPNKPSPIKKKFNVFRALVPRDKLGDWRAKGLNRIRNTWAYVQLKKKATDTDMMVFHDLDIDYFI